MYDAIVVGARCAGSPTAMLLARKGYRVLLVDHARFPSDTISTHIVWQSGAALLYRWGLLDRVVASNCPPISEVTLDFGSFSFTGVPPPADGVHEAYAPRRTVLDKILVDAAVNAGVEFREGFSVRELITDGDHVTGIRGSGKGGSVAAEHARITVGADGIHSFIARRVNAVEYNRTPASTSWYYTYWSGIKDYIPHLCSRPNRAFGGPPTNDGLVCIGVAWTNQEFHEFRADIEGNYFRTLELDPEFSERVRNGKREERFRGTADLPGFFRKRYGPGWVLAGDAAYHKDPITARGISDAFRDAQLLAEALDAGLSGRRALGDALAEFEQQRNDEVAAMCDFTRDLASLSAPAPEMQKLLAALPGNQHHANRFIGILAGTVSIPEFFGPENVQQILNDSSPHSAGV
jgi:flavin-dependent dehydrogenase